MPRTPRPRDPSTPLFLILAEGQFGPLTSKTANSCIRYTPERVLGVIDSRRAGKTANEILGFGGDIPVIATIGSVYGHLKSKRVKPLGVTCFSVTLAPGRVLSCPFTFIDVIFFKRATQSHVAFDGLKRALPSPTYIAMLRSRVPFWRAALAPWIFAACGARWRGNFDPQAPIPNIRTNSYITNCNQLIAWQYRN